MDLSSISFLKPYIVNQQHYKLAQQGRKPPDRIPEVIKVREHHKRYNNLRASRNLYNTTNCTPEKNFAARKRSWCASTCATKGVVRARISAGLAMTPATSGKRAR